jgi:hypothetical protein
MIVCKSVDDIVWKDPNIYITTMLEMTMGGEMHLVDHEKGYVTGVMKFKSLHDE